MVRTARDANLSKLPPEIVDGIRALLKGGQVFHPLDDTFSIRRALPHGHVAALLGLARQLGLTRLLHRNRSRNRDLFWDFMVSPQTEVSNDPRC